MDIDLVQVDCFDNKDSLVAFLKRNRIWSMFIVSFWTILFFVSVSVLLAFIYPNPNYSLFIKSLILICIILILYGGYLIVKEYEIFKSIKPLNEDIYEVVKAKVVKATVPYVHTSYVVLGKNKCNEEMLFEFQDKIDLGESFKIFEYPKKGKSTYYFCRK